MTTAAANTGNQASPSAALAITFKTGMAIAQTAYAISNGRGLTSGEPLRMTEDAALISAANAGPLNRIFSKRYFLKNHDQSDLSACQIPLFSRDAISLVSRQPNINELLQ